MIKGSFRKILLNRKEGILKVRLVGVHLVCRCGVLRRPGAGWDLIDFRRLKT